MWVDVCQKGFAKNNNVPWAIAFLGSISPLIWIIFPGHTSYERSALIIKDLLNEALKPSMLESWRLRDIVPFQTEMSSVFIIEQSQFRYAAKSVPDAFE